MDHIKPQTAVKAILTVLGYGDVHARALKVSWEVGTPVVVTLEVFPRETPTPTPSDQ